MAEIHIPRIQELAPNFDAVSTKGIIRLSDFVSDGKWILLFSHPADFTPVCSTELIEFARHQPDWDRLSVQPIGLSIDSLQSHIAWVMDLERISEVKITFPVIADVDQKVSALYGLVYDAVGDSSTVRSVFIIDTKGLIRALLYYPQELGRSVKEIVRIIEGLQTADANNVSCPVDWEIGDPVVVPSPTTIADANKRNGGESGMEVKTWYLTTRTLPKR
jgi:peroxiredoxin (alkyl hydroperoxide reductase subunit C)